MSTPTPTPRPALKATGMRRRHARCPEAELTTLTTERDHWQKIAVSASHEREHNANVAQAMTAERDQLRAELAAEREKVTMLLSDAYALTKNWHDRAERAEADAAAYLKRAESFRKIGDEAEADLAAERARLDWLISGGVCMIQHTGGFHVSRLHAPVSRAAIDAAMKEDAK